MDRSQQTKSSTFKRVSRSVGQSAMTNNGLCTLRTFAIVIAPRTTCRVGFLIIVFFFGLSLCSTAQSPAATGTPSEAIESTLVHYGDLVDVDVVGNLDGDWRGTLTPEGFIQGLLYAPEP